MVQPLPADHVQVHNLLQLVMEVMIAEEFDICTHPNEWKWFLKKCLLLVKLYNDPVKWFHFLWPGLTGEKQWKYRIFKNHHGN